MNRLLALLAGLFAIAVIYTAVLAPVRPVLITINPDPSEVRPRGHPVMNPFRDREPERAAVRFLEALRNKDRRALVEIEYDRIESEIRYPIQSWRIAARVDQPGVCDLTYWVRRGGGYWDGEENVSLTVRNGRVVDFSAIY